MLTAIGLLLSLAAASSGPDTLLLDDGTLATTSIIDTNGSFFIVRNDSARVKIDKKQVRRAGRSVAGGGLDTGRVSRQAPLTVEKAVDRIVSGYRVKKGPLSGGDTIACQKRPLKNSGTDEKPGAVFSAKIASFLAGHGPVRVLSATGLFFYLSGNAVPAGGVRYLAFPAEIAVRTRERKITVSSFVKLDKAGNFVPAATGSTLQALERETSVRFVVVDLPQKAIVFDERLSDVDKGLKELDPKKSGAVQNRAGENSILIIERNCEELLKKQFK
jgi:hypothetical protein